MRCPGCGASVHVKPPGASGGEVDLPAPKSSSLLDLDLPAAKPSASFDLDLPAPKVSGPSKHKGTQVGLGMPTLDAPSAAAAVPKPMQPAPLDLADLPAPKAAAPKAAPRLAPAFDDLDLPAAKGNADLPAYKTAGKPAATQRIAPSLTDDLTDLPAPRAIAPTARIAPPMSLDPSGSNPFGEDMDLPAPKGAANVARGIPAAAAKPAPARANSLPKDSLAIDPEPFFERGGNLSDLDDMALARSPSHELEDLPAPKAKSAGDNLIAGVKASFGAPKVSVNDRGAAKPAVQGTKLGLGSALTAKLPKDSLDMPAAMGSDASAAPFIIDNSALPAPSDLPKVRGPKAAPAAEPLILGEIDLPSPRDLPVVKNKPAGTAMGMGPLTTPKDSLDLPAPADLPQIKAFQDTSGTEMGLGGLDLPAPADLPQAKKPSNDFNLNMDDGFDLGPGMPGEGSGLDLDQGFGASFGSTASKTLGGMSALDALDQSLELPPPVSRNTKTAEPSSLIDLSKLALPSIDTNQRAPAPFGSTLDLSPDDLSSLGGNVLPLPSLGDRASNVLPLPSLDNTGFGDIGSTRGQTMELDSMFELGSSVAVEPMSGFGAGNTGTADFGELDFGLGAPGAAPAPMPMPMPIPQPAGGGFDSRSVEDELLGGDEGPIAPTVTKKKKRKMPAVAGVSVPGWVWAVTALALIGGGGAFLGLMTPHGYFGVYFVEQLLPAAGDPVKVASAIQQAEKQALSDTYVDVRKSLATLADARNEAGLNRLLLTRSLLHEALYQLRFGEDPQSAQRSVAILSRVMERGADAPGLMLGRAADAARGGNVSEGVTLLKQVPKDDDPYRALVSGEIALLQQRYADAVKAFDEAQRHSGGARASWGLARGLIGLEKRAEAELAVAATLKASPRHSGALARMAEIVLLRGEPNEAIVYTQKATGAMAVDGIRPRPSRRDRADAWALEGEIQEKLEQPREALAAYEQALSADPLRVGVLLGSGRMLMRLARPRDALARFDSALSAKPSDKPDMLQRIPIVEATVGSAQALLALERPQEALTRVQPLLATFKDNPEISLWLGHAQQALEKNDLAEAAFRRAIELSPNTFAGYVALSQLLFKTERPEEAARTLSEATGKVEDSAEVRRMLGYSELNRHHLPEAQHHFEAALRFEPRDSTALFGLATTQRKVGELAKAQASLDRLEKLDPGHPGLPLERGQLCEARGDYAAAVDAYRKALKERPNDTDLKLRLGAALVTAGNVDEADSILKEVLRDRPTSAEAEHYVGRVLFARNDTAQAVQRFERAVSFEPLRSDFHLFLGWARLEQNNLSGALESISKAIERDPNLGDAYWLLGRIELRTGAVKDALEHFQRTLKLKPGRHEALAAMGDAYDQLRQLPEAVDAYTQAVKAVPENGEWWYRLGSLELDRGNRGQSRVALSEAVLRGDRLFTKPIWLADAHRLYADQLRDEKRVGEALEHYRMYLTTAPSNARDRSEIEQIVKSMQQR